VKLRCVLPYRNDARGLIYSVGQVIDDPAVIVYLLTDAPGCFTEHTDTKAAKVEDKTVKITANKGL
jgi:hypothetical protein